MKKPIIISLLVTFLIISIWQHILPHKSYEPHQHASLQLDTTSATKAPPLPPLAQLSVRDAQLALNLLYWSYERSRIVLQTQDALLAHLETSWQAYANCTSMRINPTHTQPYPQPNLLPLARRAAQLFESYQKTQTTYAHMLDATIEQPFIENVPLKEFLKEVRQQARIAQAQACISIFSELRQSLRQAIEFLQHMCVSKLLLDDVEQAFEKGILSIASQAAINGFVRLDKQFNKQSATVFQHFIQGQQLYNKIWYTLETSRANYYRQLYHTFYQQLQMHKFPRETFYQACNAQGLIKHPEQPLPTHESI